MHPKDVRRIIRIPGVRGASFVGYDGQIVAHEGHVPLLLHARLARGWTLVSNGDQTSIQPSLQEIHWEGGIVLVAPTLGGLIVVETDRNANVGMLRLELNPLREQLNSTFSTEKIQRGGA